MTSPSPSPGPVCSGVVGSAEREGFSLDADILLEGRLERSNLIDATADVVLLCRFWKSGPSSLDQETLRA